MQATQCLREEHQIILKVLDCFEIAVGDAAQTNRVSAETFQPFIEFFQGFADKCHHCKEENRLFPKMEEAGIPREGGPIGVMVQEHELGRQYVRTIAGLLDKADGGDESAVDSLLENARKFIGMLRDHINKEDHCLFGMAEQLIKDESLVSLVQAYEEATTEGDYEQTFNTTRAIAFDLMKKYDVDAPTV